MNGFNTLIKWPGGKTREIKNIEGIIPSFNRYVEPFFGGGAMYFYLRPQKALINDISKSLMDFYTLVKEQNIEFYRFLSAYYILITKLIKACEHHYDKIFDSYLMIKSNKISENIVLNNIENILIDMKSELYSIETELIILDKKRFETRLVSMVFDKMKRTLKNEEKAPFSGEDLKENLITGFTSGMYMYFRDIHNDILLHRQKNISREFNTANFYFVREYCYGSMFRYNNRGEFNIPYGGMSYNRKDFKTKIDNIFSTENKKLLKNTDIFCLDFEKFLEQAKLTEDDFMFLDPPYDTDFSDYEGKDFTQDDQRRLAEILKKTSAKFILIIKNTDFIYLLYKDHFNILNFNKTYTYNVRSRNERNVEHLIITNINI